MDEQAAVTRLKHGDIGGLEPLVRTHQVQAVRLAYGITRDRALAEDIVQAAFLRAFDRIHQLDPQRPFGPWFLRSVINAALKASDRSRHQVSLDQSVDGALASLADLLPAPGPTPETTAEQAETRHAIWVALGRLPPAQRAVIIQRYYLDLSEAEMADTLQLPTGTIKWRLHRARARLRAVLRPWFGVPTAAAAPVLAARTELPSALREAYDD